MTLPGALPPRAVPYEPEGWCQSGLTFPRRGNDRCMDESQNVAGTRLTCTNVDCDCELQINTPCPHGTTYTCACGQAFEPVG